MIILNFSICFYDSFIAKYCLISSYSSGNRKDCTKNGHPYITSADFSLERFRIKSFSCFAVFIIKAPPNIAVKFFLPATSQHISLKSADFYLFCEHTLLMPPEKSVFQFCCGFGANRKPFAPCHKPAQYVQTESGPS